MLNYRRDTVVFEIPLYLSEYESVIKAAPEAKLKFLGINYGVGVYGQSVVYVFKCDREAYEEFKAKNPVFTEIEIVENHYLLVSIKK